MKRALVFAAAAVVLAEVARVSGAASPTELPAYVPFGAVWMTAWPCMSKMVLRPCSASERDSPSSCSTA